MGAVGTLLSKWYYSQTQTNLTNKFQFIEYWNVLIRGLFSTKHNLYWSIKLNERETNIVTKPHEVLWVVMGGREASSYLPKYVWHIQDFYHREKEGEIFSLQETV